MCCQGHVATIQDEVTVLVVVILILLVFQRYAKEYRIFGGLWYGTAKPDMLVFLVLQRW